MKNLSESIRIFLIIILAFSFIQCSSDRQQTKESMDPSTMDELEESPIEMLTPGPAGKNFVYIVLLVDTENIKKGKEEDYCAFANQPTNISDQDFLTKVIRGDSIIWMAYSYSNPGKDYVNITGITGTELDKILNKKNVSTKKGKALGHVKDKANRWKTKKYKLQFDVISDGDTLRNLEIDPKLRVIK